MKLPVYVFIFEAIIKKMIKNNKPDYWITNGYAKIPILRVSDANIKI